MSSLLRLNLGCGDRHMQGWVNVDHISACNPEIVCDLEKFPWPFDDDSVGEIMMSHVLEHLGESRDVYLGIIKELYRVCTHNASIHIYVPHPRHDHFLWDPTHVRPILIEGLQMFDQSLNREWIFKKAANTPLGIYLGVDFRIIKSQYILDRLYQEKIKRGEVKIEEIAELLRINNNVCQQINIQLSVVKEKNIIKAKNQG